MIGKLMTEQSYFQKQFFAKGTGGTLFTQKEFDDALIEAKAEIMAMAIEASKMAVVVEREACAKIAYELENDTYGKADDFKSVIAEAILNRVPSQRQ
jgi:hypothetical protein